MRVAALLPFMLAAIGACTVRTTDGAASPKPTPTVDPDAHDHGPCDPAAAGCETTADDEAIESTSAEMDADDKASAKKKAAAKKAADAKATKPGQPGALYKAKKASSGDGEEYGPKGSGSALPVGKPCTDNIPDDDC